MEVTRIITVEITTVATGPTECYCPATEDQKRDYEIELRDYIGADNVKVTYVRDIITEDAQTHTHTHEE